MTQAQVDAINSGITKSIVDSRVIPSTTHPGYAVNAEYSLYASDSDWADNAGHSNNAELAISAENAATASTALTANAALTAETALTANYAPDYTPLSTFNYTLGDLSSIIHGI